MNHYDTLCFFSMSTLIWLYCLELFSSGLHVQSSRYTSKDMVVSADEKPKRPLGGSSAKGQVRICLVVITRVLLQWYISKIHIIYNN
jgi:hypothetical protein